MNLKWLVKQLFPLTYVSEYGEIDPETSTVTRKLVTVWRMWLGRCFAVRTWEVK